MDKVTKKDVIETIRQVMGELVEFDMHEISDDQKLVEDMGINSIAIVQIFLTCQEKYGVDLSDEMRLMEPMSIDSLAEKIVKKIEENSLSQDVKEVRG